MDDRCIKCGYTAAQVPQYSDIASQLIHTNEPPEIHEALFLRSELQRGCDTLAALAEEVKTLQEKLDGLRTRQKLTRQFVHDHKCILSPYRRPETQVPQEILTEIFHCAEPVVSTNVSHGIWRLGRVCSYWRSVVLSSPSLWTDICVSIAHTEEHLVPILKEIIVRSGNTRLKIELVYHLMDSTLSDAIRIISKASHRWHTISLNNIPESHLPLFSTLKGRVPLLTKLSYKCSTFLNFDWLADAPSLQELVIHTETLALPFSATHIPWSQLRECSMLFYSGDNVTPDHELDLLRLCPNLETYKLLDHSDRSPSVPLPSNLVQLPGLRALTFKGTSPLLQCLILPSLDRVVAEGQFLATPSLRDLFSRSYSLSTLDIRCWPSNREQSSLAVRLISEASLQNLTTLRVAYDTSHSSCHALINLLTILPGQGSVILPRLEKLHLHPKYYTSPKRSEDHSASIIEMTRSRWCIANDHQETTHLTFLEYKPHFYELPSFLQGTLAPLLTFREQGLRISIDRFFLEI